MARYILIVCALFAASASAQSPASNPAPFEVVSVKRSAPEARMTRANAEISERIWNQYAADVVYRFLPREQAYAGVRYNKAEGALVGIPDDVGANRWQLAGGWFVNPHILMKAEYVRQEYQGYRLANIRNGGTVSGAMLEGFIGF